MFSYGWIQGQGWEGGWSFINFLTNILANNSPQFTQQLHIAATWVDFVLLQKRAQ